MSLGGLLFFEGKWKKSGSGGEVGMGIEPGRVEGGDTEVVMYYMRKE